MNKMGTSKVGAISEAQKAQTIQNCNMGDSLDFLKIQFVAKNCRNDPSETLKTFEKYLKFSTKKNEK